MTVQGLPVKVRNAINYAPLSNSRQDVQNLLLTCFNYPGGWLALLGNIEFNEGGSLAWLGLYAFLSSKGFIGVDRLEVVETLESDQSSSLQIPKQVTVILEGNFEKFTLEEQNSFVFCTF